MTFKPGLDLLRKQRVNKGSFAKGHDPRRNVSKPGSGQLSPAFRDNCRTLTHGEVLAKATEWLMTHDPGDPTWRWCAEWVSQYAESKAPTLSKESVTMRDGSPRAITYTRAG